MVPPLVTVRLSLSLSLSPCVLLVQMGEGMVLVFEDDAHLAPDFERRWRRLHAELREDQGWDVVFLGCVFMSATIHVLVLICNAPHQVLGLPQSV